MREKKQDPKSEENAPSKRWSFWTRFLQKPPVFFRPVAGQPFFRSKYLFFVCWINLWIQRLQFDAVWYLAQNPDVAKSGLEPYTHYAHHGRAEGRPPGPMKESWEPFYEKNESREKNLLEDKPESQRIAVAVHCYYPELWPQIEAKLVALPDHFDLFITAPSDRAASVRALVSKAFPRARFFFGPDRGMDIAPFLTLIPTLMKEKYVAVCKLHTKKGDRGVPGSGSVWRQIMLETLVGSGENFSQAIHAFAEDPSVCMIGPAALFQSGPRLMYRNGKNFKKILKDVYACPLPKLEWGFFAGTMFWVRPEALEALSRFSKQAFSEHAHGYKVDGKLEHALERFFGLISVFSSGKIGLLHLKASHPTGSCLTMVESGAFAGKADITHILRQFSRLEIDEAIIRASGLFDEAYYVQQCESSLHSGMNLVSHYLLHGRFAGLWPNRHFSPREYQCLHRGVAKKRIEPFVDYLTQGAQKKLRFRWDPQVERTFVPHYPHAVLSAKLVNWEEVRSIQRDNRLISIVIPVCGEGELTRNCIRSILNAEGTAAYEIILVDNGSDRKDRAILKEIARGDSRIRLIVNAENYNFALGCNIGFTHSRGETLVFLNNDTIVTSGWLDKLVAPLADRRIAAVQPKLLHPDGTVQNVGMVFSEWSPVSYPIYSGAESSMPCLDQSRSFQVITGACMGLRAKDFAAARGFDPIFVNGQEDIDLCLRLTQGTDRVCWYEAGAVVFHHEGQTPGRGRHIAHNRREFISRWSESIEPDDADYYKQDGFEVVGWTVDSPDYLKEGVAMFKPVLTPRQSPDEETIFSCAEPFHVWAQGSLENDFPPQNSYVPGEAARKIEGRSILVCGHAAGKELFGAERSFLDLLEALALLNINVIVTFPAIMNLSYLEAVKKRVSGIYVFQCKSWARGFPAEKTVIARFESILKFHHIAAVHVNTIMLREPLIAAKRAKVAGIAHVREIIHEDQSLVLRLGLKPEEVMNQIRARADFLIANSKKTAAAIGHGPGTFIAPNVVRADILDIPNPIDPHAIVFALISSNIRKKGIFDLMDVAKLCENSIPNAVFAWIGPEDGEDMRRLKKQYSGSKLPKNIRFLGYKETSLAAIAEANVVLNLSLFAESFGRSVAEAMAARRPVIAYAWGALPELVQDKVSGYLVPHRDVRAVAMRVAQLCESPELIPTLGAAGREIIKNYSIERLSRRLDSIYAEAIDKKKAEPWPAKTDGSARRMSPQA